MMTARFFRSRRLSQIVFVAKIAVAVLVLARQLPAADPEPPSKSLGPVPQSARLAFEEDWKSGKIDAEKWYRPRKQWGQGNNGVVPENVRIEQDLVRGRRKNVLVCEAHGDRYDGPILGWRGRKTRVGGLIVSKPFFASGRFEVVMKIGSGDARKAGPENPNRPRGAVPAIWTYGYRWVEGNAKRKTEFLAETPLYNPHMPAYGIAGNEYWSEIDFPELGKNGDLTKGLYNTFCQNRHDWKTFDVPDVADGRYHTFTTIWRTRLKPLEGVTDNQTVKHLGHWWIRDRNVPFDSLPRQSAQTAGPRPVRRLSGRESHPLDRWEKCRREHPACSGDGGATQSGNLAAEVGRPRAVENVPRLVRLGASLAVRRPGRCAKRLDQRHPGQL